MKSLVAVAVLMIGCLLSLPVVAAPITTVVVELPYWFKVLELNQIYTYSKTQHLVRIVCFLEKGKHVVYEDLETGLCHVTTSYEFGDHTVFVSRSSSEVVEGHVVKQDGAK